MTEMIKEIKVYYCQDCLDTKQGLLTPGCTCTTGGGLDVWVEDSTRDRRQYMGSLTGATIEETLDLIKHSRYNDCEVKIIFGNVPDVQEEI